jgi:hypothetical protein
MSVRTNISASRVHPLEALHGKQWLEEAIAAAFGMWRHRSDIDPVAWQREIRAEWEENYTRRVRTARQTRRRRHTR